MRLRRQNQTATHTFVVLILAIINFSHLSLTLLLNQNFLFEQIGEMLRFAREQIGAKCSLGFAREIFFPSCSREQIVKTKGLRIKTSVLNLLKKDVRMSMFHDSYVVFKKGYPAIFLFRFLKRFPETCAPDQLFLSKTGQ